MASSILSAGALAAEQTTVPVTLHYLDRPPYMVVSANGLTGITGQPAFMAFKKAGIAFELRKTPFVRQLRIVEKDTGQDCMIGLFKLPERENFAKFTKPIYRDQTPVILTESGNAGRIESVRSIDGLFSDPGLTRLAKLGYSYGAALDALIEKYQPKSNLTADENLLMLKAIKMKIADYMVIAPEEIAEAISAAGFSDQDFKSIRVKNMPSGDFRHIMCSKSVPDEVIKKLNAAIDF
jgi:polar amino acid transport system substrate-binding protein